MLVTGPGVLDSTIWRQANSVTVHLVNLTNPMMMKGSVRELIPIGPQQIAVRLPEGSKRPQRVQLLAADKGAKFNWDGRHVRLSVLSVLDHEVVAIDV
jgi:hypothetical protein